MKKVLTSLLALSISTPLAAAPKPSSSAIFNPVIAYSYASGKSMDLRLANADGSTAITVHKTSYGSISQFDLSPKAHQMIAWNERGVLKAKSWYESTVGAISVDKNPKWTYGSYVQGVDFAPSAQLIAVGDVSPSGYSIKILDFGGALVRTIPIEHFPIEVRWISDETIAFHTEVQNVGDQLYTVPSAGGAPQLAFTERNIEAMDVARGSNKMVLSLWRPEFGENIRMGEWQVGSVDSGTGRANVTLYEPLGLLGHYGCNDTKLIYRAFYRIAKRPVYVLDIATQDSQLWMNDSNIHHTDWMPGSC